MIRTDLILLPCLLIIIFIFTRHPIYIFIYTVIYREYSLVIGIFSISVIFSVIFGTPPVYRMAVNTLFYHGFNLKHNFEDIPKQPCIIVSNYNAKENIVDYTANCLFPVKTVLLINNKKLEIVVSRLYERDRYYAFPSETLNFDNVKRKIKELLDKNYYIFAYVERHVQTKQLLSMKITKIVNRTPLTISSLRKGMFKIAQELQVPILPVVMSSISLNSLLVTEKCFQIKIGSLRRVENVQETMNDVFLFMRENLRLMRLNSL